MKNKFFVTIALIVCFVPIFDLSAQNNNTLSGMDANERNRIKEELKRELRRELMQAMREEADAEYQRKQEVERIKEEIRRELLQEMKQEANSDKLLRAQLRDELIKEMKSEQQSNDNLRNEIRAELMKDYRKDNATASDIRREMKEELRREMEKDGEISPSKDTKHKNHSSQNDDNHSKKHDSKSHLNNEEHSNKSKSEIREEKREHRNELKEEERRYRLKFERGRQKGVQFGAMGGINLSNFRQNRETTISGDQIAGFVAGGYFRFATKVVYFQPEILYAGKGSNFGINEDNLQGDRASTNTRLRLNSIDVPLMFGLKILEHRKLNLRIMAGPLVSFFINQNSSKQFENKEFNPVSAGYQAGIGFDIGNLTFDARYEGSFTDLNTQAARDAKFSGDGLRNSVFRATVGFRIF